MLLYNPFFKCVVSDILWIVCIYAKPCDFQFFCLFVSIFKFHVWIKPLTILGDAVTFSVICCLKVELNCFYFCWNVREKKRCNSSLDNVRMMIPHERYQRKCVVSHTAGVYAKHLTDVDMVMTAFPLISYVQFQMKVGLPSHSTSWIPNLFFCLFMRIADEVQVSRRSSDLRISLGPYFFKYCCIF